MEIKSEYMFEYSSNKRNNQGSLVIRTYNHDVVSAVKDVFSECDISEEKNHEDGNYTLRFVNGDKNENIKIQITSYDINKTSYCSIEIHRKTKKKCVESLADIECRMRQSMRKEDSFYFVFDSVSAYYCEKMYPKIAKFERTLRILLINVYSIAIEKSLIEYFSERKIEINKGDETLFETLGFQEIKDILFSERWSEIDADKLLNSEVNYGDMSDEDIREVIKNIRPKTDMERFFKNKIIFNERELNEIKEVRNRVAHNKKMSKRMYDKAQKVVESNIKKLELANIQVRTEDFSTKSLNSITLAAKELVDHMMSSLYTEPFQEMSKNMKKLSEAWKSQLVQFDLDIPDPIPKLKYFKD